MPITNLAAVTDINRIVHMINQGGYDISPTQFYDMMLLDSIKLGNENYVHLKHTENYTLPAGTQKLQKRRWGGLTAHTTPLLEGIPPVPDKTSMESITFTATAFGRYMEFTDRVKLDQIDPILAHYTKELGDVAVRTLERYARETMLSAASKLFPGNKLSVGELEIGDKITIADLRFAALRMARLLVKPINGYFNYICSPEFLYDFMDDPLVEKYMQINQTTKSLFDDGKPFPMFQIQFIQTMLDEHYTPELDNVGEWYNGSAYNLRVYAVDGQKVYYSNVPAAKRSVNSATSYLHDGTAIAAGQKVSWNLTDWTTATTTSIIEINFGADPVTRTTLTVVASGATGPQINKVDADALVWNQLPVHKGILYGTEGLVKIGIAGEQNAKTYVKALGSAGVLDPIDQRQTIGFKINSIGFGILRDEAIVVTFSVPTQAVAVSGLTASVVQRAQATANATPDDETDVLAFRQYTVDDKDITNGTNIKG
jgi:hypothetical protein